MIRGVMDAEVDRVMAEREPAPNPAHRQRRKRPRGNVAGQRRRHPRNAELRAVSACEGEADRTDRGGWSASGARCRASWRRASGCRRTSPARRRCAAARRPRRRVFSLPELGSDAGAVERMALRRRHGQRARRRRRWRAPSSARAGARGRSSSPPQSSTARSIDVAQLADVARPAVALEQRHAPRWRSQAGGARCVRLARACGREQPRQRARSRRAARAAAASTSEMPLSRKNRSCRKRPRATSASRSRLVAATKRTSIGRGRRPPTRSTSRSSSTRSSLTCERQRQLADLVEEHRAAVGRLEQARLGLHGAGEGALLVPEQLALEQRLGEAPRS